MLSSTRRECKPVIVQTARCGQARPASERQNLQEMERFSCICIQRAGLRLPWEEARWGQTRPTLSFVGRIWEEWPRVPSFRKCAATIFSTSQSIGEFIDARAVDG